MLTYKKTNHYALIKSLVIIGSFSLGLLAKKPLESLFYPKTPPSLSTETNQQEAKSSELMQQGIQAHQQNHFDEAIKLFRQAIKSDPETLRSLVRLAGTLTRKNNYEDAASLYKTVITVEPSFISAYVSLGMCLHKLERYNEAIKQYQTVLSLSPDYFDAHQQISRTFCEVKDFDRAIAHAQKAITLQPTNIYAQLNLGHAYNKRGDLETAVSHYKKALTLDSNFANAHYNLGYTLKLQGKFDEAIKHLNKALEIQPDYVDAHIALSHAHWFLGNFDQAWKHYEWRWKLFNVDPRAMQIPFWDGSDLKNKTILLYSEQGLGDTLQFIRLAKQIKEKGARIICKVQKPLIKLLATYPYVDKFITKISEAEKVDYQAPLMSLPGMLHVTPQTIPADIPYLKTDKKLADTWKTKLDTNKKFNVGLCWHVDPIHDIDKSPVSKRSIELAVFEPLGSLKNVTFYSLQKGMGEDQLAQLSKSLKVKSLGADFDTTHGAFMDSAAVIQQLDLVIAVDTSVAHVAAALGKETWMLLPYSPDCRWGLGCSTTPWYPTMTLFRQDKPFDWHHVVEKIKVALNKKLQK